jgi:hypothetical protein
MKYFPDTIVLYNFENKSIYVDKQKPLKAIEQKDYHILGDRRNYDRND